MLMAKQPRLAIRTLHGWAISVLRNSGAIIECEYHGWMQDRADPHARDRAIEMARKIRRRASLQMPLQHRCGKSWSQSATPAQSVPRISGPSERKAT